MIRIALIAALALTLTSLVFAQTGTGTAGSGAGQQTGVMAGSQAQPGTPGEAPREARRAMRRGAWSTTGTDMMTSPGWHRASTTGTVRRARGMEMRQQHAPGEEATQQQEKKSE